MRKSENGDKGAKEKIYVWKCSRCGFTGKDPICPTCGYAFMRLVPSRRRKKKNG